MPVLLFLIMTASSLGVLLLGMRGLQLVNASIYGRYDRSHARALVADWEMQLELLDAAGRELARHTPPANIAAALALART